MGSIVHRGKWIVQAESNEQAEKAYLGQRFKVRYSSDHEILVQVDKVELYGGCIATFCTIVKTLKRYKKCQSNFRIKGEYVHPGRLEPVHG